MPDPRAGSAESTATAPAVRDALEGTRIGGRLAEQLRFVVEVDRVKQVLRRSLLADASRAESDGEHQWHVALMALLLAEHAAEPVDPLRVVTMLLVHDLVEIDAGDAYLYDPAARAAAVAREEAAAARIFGMLPADQGPALREAWEEFEAGETADARFARSLDRLQPLLLNAASGGVSWRAHGVTAAQVMAAVVPPMKPGSPALAEVAEAVIAAAVAGGILEA